MSPRARHALLLALLAAACAEAPVRRPAEPARYRGWWHTLPSGMRIVVYERGGARHFRLAASYAGGTSTDPRSEEGTAVLLARLAERAGPSGVPLSDRILAAGSSAEVHVTRHDVVFEQRGRAAALRGALEVERDRLADPLAGVDDDEFLEAREALALELSLEADMGGDDFQVSTLLAHSFPWNPGARPRGTEASVRSLSRAALARWARQHLVRERLVLVIAAPGEPSEVGKMAMEVFGEGDPSRRVPPAAPEPTGQEMPHAGELPVVREASERPMLWLAWLLPAEVAARAVTTDSAAAVARAAATERVRRPDLAEATAGVVSRAVRLPGGAAVAIGIGLKGERNAEEVARKVGEEVADYASSPSAAWGLAALGDALRRRTFLAGEDVDVGEAARWLRDTGQADFVTGYQAQLDGLARVGFPPAAAAALAKSRMHRLLVLPLRPVPPDVEALGFLTGAAVHRAAGGAAPPAAAVRSLLADPGFTLRRRTLGNGLELVAVRLSDYPTAVARLVVRSPFHGTPPFPAGIAPVALGLAEKSWSAGGAFTCPAVERGMGKEMVFFQVAAPAGELPAALESIACATRSRSVSRSFSAVRDAQVRALQSPPWRVLAPALKGLYPGHPYGGVVEGAGLARATEADAERWLAGLLRPERATLLVVGKVPPEPELDRLVDSALGGWTAGGVPLAEAPLPAPGQGSTTLVVRDGDPAARVLMLARLPSSDREASHALRHLLAERLRTALPREAPIQVDLDRRRLDQVLSIGSLLPSRECAQGVDRILRELRRLAAGGIAADEAGRARWQVARDLAARHDTAALAIDDLSRAAELGAVPDEAARVESVAALSAERISAVASRIGAGQEAITVLGGRGLAPSLAALGLEVEIVEWKGASGK